MTNDKAAQLRRDIGFFGAAFLVLNAMIGAGIFALPGKVAVNAGLLSPWLFLAVGVLFTVIFDAGGAIWLAWAWVSVMVVVATVVVRRVGRLTRG